MASSSGNVPHQLPPHRLEPRIRPWLGGLLWLATNAIVVIFGQFLFPRALMADPAQDRTTSNVLIGCVAFVLLAVLHAWYWRRVVRHLRAESQVRRQPGLAPQFVVSRPTYNPIPVGVGITVLIMALLIVLYAVPALGSAQSVDAPLLSLVYAAVAMAPFGIALTAVGVVRRP
ncbi:hypothetical protein [Nocardioides astragali]|uniref:DUF4328 domain-containing protein n=1 Tax=Nocardioides astragali TaxID=1776736 RepID=A0ABW2MZA7_9ACTN|nr:hypothetical protein [Nocardioides astragali]